MVAVQNHDQETQNKTQKDLLYTDLSNFTLLCTV